jgi:holo-[acyl-carrier protein] synthase
MIKGIGTDIVALQRIEQVLQRQGDRFAQRILTEKEWQEFQVATQPARLLAKRFAAKEAAAKALGTGIGRGISWQDFQVDHDEQGAPLLIVQGGAQQRLTVLGANQCLLSLSDEEQYAVAFVVLSA